MAPQPTSSNPRVLQLPKFAVVDVMIDLNGRECLQSDKWEVKDAFWKAVLWRLNELYPENQSDVRNINHVKRTWSALRQRVLQRWTTRDREMLPSDMRVLYLIGEVDTYEDDKPAATCQIQQQHSLSNLFGNVPSYDDSLFDESLPPNSPSPEPIQMQNFFRPETPKPSKQNGTLKRAKRELQERLILSRIEREKAKTELLNAQRRLVEAQIRHLDKNGGSVDLLLSLNDNFNKN